MKNETIIQLAQYVLSKNSTLSPDELISLIFLADKYSLMRIGRTITGDHFEKSPLGPRGINTEKIINTIYYIINTKPLNTDLLSQTDINITDQLLIHIKNINISSLILELEENKQSQEIPEIELFNRGPQFLDFDTTLLKNLYTDP